MSQWSGLSATFKAQVKRKGNKPRIGIALSGVAKYYSRGKEFVMDGNTYSDELSSAPSLSISAKMTGGLSTVNKLNIDILNQNLESNHFAEGGSYPNPENTDVKAYLVYDSGTTNIADAIQFFRGMIDDFPQINYKSLKITCTSIDKITFKKIGDLVTNDDAPSGYQLPEDSLGRVKPIIYGDHRFAINWTKDNNQLAINYPFKRENNVVEAIPLGGGRFLIANHTCNSYNSDGDAFWFFDDDLGRLVEVNDYSIISTNPLVISVQGSQVILESSSGFIGEGNGRAFTDNGVNFTTNIVKGDYLIIPFDGDDENPGTYRIEKVVDATHLRIAAPYFAASSDDSNIEYKIERYPNFTHWRSPINAVDIDGWSHVSRVHDLSIATAAEYSFNAGTSGIKSFSVEFEIFPIEQTSILSTRMYIKGNSTDHADLWLAANGDPLSSFSDKTNTTQFHKHAYDVGMAYINNGTIEFIKAAGTTTGTAYIYEIIQKINYTKKISTDNMKIYFGGKGMEYGNWIYGRHTNEGYSETHIDDDKKGYIIENAAGIIESILRDTLSLADANNNMDAFNVASNDLSTSKLSFAITERIEIDKLIHDILERVKSVGYFDYDDKFKMVVYDSGTAFSESGTNTPNDNDKFLFNPSESGTYSDNTRQFDEHPIIEDSFWIKKNPVNQIVTNFTIEYYKTYDGKFARKLTDTDITYHAEDISKTFNHPYTKDQTTAQIWLTFLKDRLNRKHWTAGWDTWYNSIGKEMWDVVNVQHPVIENLLTDYATKKWRILNIGIETDLGKISVEVEEQ